ncbi:MAG: rab-GTPase-TBC domain-containing protein [Linnemannia gamsii]|nr:MAG: rab-GTPase-TBC domain-containing protein [Linnemannia gamsii]
MKLTRVSPIGLLLSAAMIDSLYRKQARIAAKEQERSLKWARMAKQYTSEANEIEYSFSDHPKFVSRVYKGIPDCWRAAAWSHLITKRAGDFDPNIRQIYHGMLEISSPEEEQIDLDIPRTMHGHIMFRTRFGPGQCALFKVLKAYSNYNSRVGYCQGMASVVATMLTFFDDEKAFELLAQLFDRYNINELVVPGFPALFEAFYIQEELTKIYAPSVFQALETMGIATPSYASRWYITLYSAGVVPYRTLLRIWDILLLEGFDWLYFMALALLKYHESTLILNNFERTMEMLNAKMDIQDDERLLKIALKLSKQAKQTGIVAKLKRAYAAKQKQPA